MVDVAISEGEIWKLMAIRRPLYGVLQHVVEFPWLVADADPETHEL